MRKHNEGYILVYVMVVLLIFCLVATSILTSAMRNLEQQQTADQKMQYRYAAAGMIEKVLADWNRYREIAIGESKVYSLPEGAVTVARTEENRYQLTAEVISDEVTLVTIVCTVDRDGKYVSSQAGTPESTATSSSAANGGASE